jgi:multiple antibiotic resistance protein
MTKGVENVYANSYIESNEGSPVATTIENVEFVKTFVGMVALMNPLGAIPILISIGSGKPLVVRRRIPKVTATAILIILLVSVWAGEIILKLFGISIEAFQAGGGILILLMAIHMLQAKKDPVKQTKQESEELSEAEIKSMLSIAVVPMAIPLMAGPGTISFSIIQGAQIANITGGRLILSLVVIAVALVAWLTLKFAEPIGKKLGETGLNIATRLMGMLLAAIGVQMIAHGLGKLLPGLAG